MHGVVASVGGFCKAQMDDVYVVGPHDLCQQAIEQGVSRAAQDLKVHLNRSKSRVYCPSYTQTFGLDPIPVCVAPGTTHEGMTVAGVPVSHDSGYVNAVMSAKTDSVMSQTQKIKGRLQDRSPQALWTLVYYCRQGAFMHWLRHVVPSLISPMLVGWTSPTCRCFGLVHP